MVTIYDMRSLHVSFISQDTLSVDTRCVHLYGFYPSSDDKSRCVKLMYVYQPRYQHTYKFASVCHVLTSVVATVVIMIIHLFISCPSIPPDNVWGNSGKLTQLRTKSVLPERCSLKWEFDLKFYQNSHLIPSQCLSQGFI